MIYLERKCFVVNIYFQGCQFPVNILQLASGYGGMTKHEVPQTSNSSVCDGSLNSLDQQLNISLMKLNALAQKNNLPCVSSSTESCSNIVPASCSGPVSCLSSHQSPPVYSPIGFPRNLSNRSSNHSQQVMIIFLFQHYFKESICCMFYLWKYFIWRSINILILM